MSFWSKTARINTTIEFSIFKLVQVPGFSLNWQFWILGPNLPQKRVFAFENGKSKHQTLHIQISLCTKLQLKLTIFFFGPNLLKKGIFLSKTEKQYFNVFSLCSHRDNEAIYCITLLTDNICYFSHWFHYFYILVLYSIFGKRIGKFTIGQIGKTTFNTEFFTVTNTLPVNMTNSIQQSSKL